MVTVFLSKSTPGENWPGLRAAEAEKKAPKFDTPEKDADPSASLMTMMKQMYQDGDDEMKRTIAKAWTESRDKSSTLDM